ncbi:hypothetical protein D6C91_09766 [Aureobasidium pullulans]|uniref:Transferase family protein n=1 Tax=Aureobasidium pullulans TaxID=5580 RepID=A0A4S9SHP5_AURPU|nr:hypothetical protein D6C91_09766 [Aureobasidium pullulans]
MLHPVMADKISSPLISIKSRNRISPTALLCETITTALSILDASVARFAPCSATWFFDAEPFAHARDPELFRGLELLFRETLSRWPHWSDQLRWAAKTDHQNNQMPYGRPVITYGGGEDVGVDWIIASCDSNLESIVPSRDARSTTDKVWMATKLPHQLQAASKLAFSNLAEFDGLPGVAVQLTAFKCGGWSVNVKIAHCLADAHSLLTFMHDWAAQSRGYQSVFSQPIFDPTMLDIHAGALNMEHPDPQVVSRARELPMHRFDWSATDAPGYPDWALASSVATMPPPDVLRMQQLSPSTHPPWPTWNLALPVEHAQIRFTAAEVSRMKDAAMASPPPELSKHNISRLDSLLSHVWMLINRARGHESSEENVYLNMTLGLRTRLSPPLPNGFVGSPILLTHVTKSGADASASLIGRTAAAIRSALSQFTPEAISAYLHDATYEVSPQRLWQAFLGSQHTIVTSWTQMRAYEIRFGRVADGAEKPQLARYVQGVMPCLDGIVQVMDIGDSGDFDISLNLESNAMRRLLEDPQLRAFA